MSVLTLVRRLEQHLAQQGEQLAFIREALQLQQQQQASIDRLIRLLETQQFVPAQGPGSTRAGLSDQDELILSQDRTR